MKVDWTVHKYGMAGMEAALKAKESKIARLTAALEDIQKRTEDAPEGTLGGYIHNRAYVGLHGDDVDDALSGKHDYHRGDGDG